MINPLDELSDIYLGQISEADNSPEAIKARVMQHVRAIRYRARKEGDQLNKAYNDYMAGQAGISATEKSMVKERLGLTGGSQHQEGMAYGLSKGTGKPSGAMAAFGKKKTKKTKPTVTIDKPDKLVSLRVSKEGYYSWRHELSEYSGMMPKKNGDAEIKITEKKVKNKVTVNPAQGQAESFAKELGGQLLEACEVFQILEVDDDQIQLLEVKDRKGKGSGTKDACYHKVKSRYSVWPSAYASGALVKCRRVGAANWGNSTKKEDVQWKDIKYKAKSGESTFLSDSDGNIAFEIVDVIAPAVQEAKVDTGRSDYGKASIRNYRRMGPGHGEPGMFDPEGKRGKTIEKRREEHKARRGVKGAKVPAYKVDEGMSYGLYKGSGKASGAMKDYLDKKAKMLTKKRNKQSDAAKNNPHFDSTQPSPSGRNKYEEVQRDDYGDPIGGPKISKKQKAKNLASNTPDEQHTTTTSEAVTFQHFMEKCWKGYEKKGMKTMFGKRYPNCVKKEEVELTDEGYGSARVGPALTMARAIDKVNPKPKIGSKRSAISNMLKMASIKKDEKLRKQKENPYSAKNKLKMVVRSISQNARSKAGATKEEYIPEEGYDIARDMGRVKPSKDKKDGTTMPPSAEMKKTQKINKGPSAAEIVKKKYGKAVMNIKKK